MLGLPYARIDVDLASRANRTERFLKLNPYGEIPVLLDADLVIAESNAILVHLARRENRTDWLPLDPIRRARVETWLSRAAGPLAYGIARARVIRLFGGNGDLVEAQRVGRRLLRAMDTHLVQDRFFAGQTPTICDLALYSYAALAPEAGVALADLGRVGDWIRRVEDLPGFVALRRVSDSE